MSELVDQIAALERRVGEADEARKTTDRLWDATEDVLDELRSLQSAFYTFSSDTDGPATTTIRLSNVLRTRFRALSPPSASSHSFADHAAQLALHKGSPLPALGTMGSVPEVAASGAGTRPHLGGVDVGFGAGLASREESLRKIRCR
ncbi:hypothetical protein [Streptomyces sp. URMC 123]|uniref:hypothetical protein n=1 Tax=Streptomyces sp. URMC 123 TaxID=3423403 RepID=UPI003F1DFCFD